MLNFGLQRGDTPVTRFERSRDGDLPGRYDDAGNAHRQRGQRDFRRDLHDGGQPQPDGRLRRRCEQRDEHLDSAERDRQRGHHDDGAGIGDQPDKESDARRFVQAMRSRMEQFELTLHPEKTQVIRFGRFAAALRLCSAPSHNVRKTRKVVTLRPATTGAAGAPGLLRCTSEGLPKYFRRTSEGSSGIVFWG